MKRPILLALLGCSALSLSFIYFNHFWIHRFDALIARQAHIYSIDPDLVWSMIYEETYFRPWRLGADGEIGLMQVTPLVGREWAASTGLRELEKQMASHPEIILRDPERNIGIGCWYLEKISKAYRDIPGAEARIIAAYNAGPSRAADWNRHTSNDPELVSTKEFVERIDIASTRAYVTSILNRYERLRKVDRADHRATIFPRIPK
ncbi:MAG: transglycosylase SLT domain-containing protein [Pyrinomonadaceae bacterium]